MRRLVLLRSDQVVVDATFYLFIMKTHKELDTQVILSKDMVEALRRIADWMELNGLIRPEAIKEALEADESKEWPLNFTQMCKMLKANPDLQFQSVLNPEHVWTCNAIKDVGYRSSSNFVIDISIHDMTARYRLKEALEDTGE